MPFSNRKPGRSLLQRLSDQRRSLVLAGLAAGAALSAALFRRSRRGADGGSGPASVTSPPTPNPSTPTPPEAAPSASPPPDKARPTPPPAEEATAAAPRAEKAPSASPPPEAAPAAPPPSDASAPDAQAPEAPAAPPPADAPAPATDAPSAPSDPPTGELSAQEASVLAVLAQSGRPDDDRTAIAVATSLERDAGEVTDVLRKLAGEGVVSGELYTAAGEKIWAVTERGVRRLGAQS